MKDTIRFKFINDPIKLNGKNKPITLMLNNAVLVNHGDEFLGPYIITPTWDAQELETEKKLFTQNFIINPIPRYEYENEAHGLTLVIG